jgi:hypothetical protein
MDSCSLAGRIFQNHRSTRSIIFAMLEKQRSSLTVNGKDVELSGFPEKYLRKTICGAASSLENVGDIENLDMTLSFGKVKLSVNNNDIALKPFPKLIIANTVIGIVSTLKGTDEKITSVRITVQ